LEGVAEQHQRPTALAAGRRAARRSDAPMGARYPALVGRRGEDRVEAPGGDTVAGGAVAVLALDERPERRGPFLRAIWRHRLVLGVLARTDFQVRYKRASFGVLWSVLLPLVQALLLVFIFRRFTQFSDVVGYPVFVLSGMITWSYFTAVISAASTAIVDATSMTDKVWFPRALLALVPAIANLVGFAVSLVVLVVTMPLWHVNITAHILLLPVATALLVAFCSALGLVLAALDVYFRDVKFLVQAALLAWFWLTPIAYPQYFAGGIAGWLDLNPATGIVTLFRLATLGADDWQRPVLVSVVVTVALLVAAIEIYRRHDRRFVDLL
jgi:ABC-type polysaccharide/polyol phosphate export permease